MFLLAISSPSRLVTAPILIAIALFLSSALVLVAAVSAWTISNTTFLPRSWKYRPNRLLEGEGDTSLSTTDCYPSPSARYIPYPGPARDGVSSCARADACHGDDPRRDGARPVVGACPGGLGLGLNNLDYSLLLGKVRRSGFSFPLGCGSTLGVGAAPDPRTCAPSCSLEGEWERWRKVDLARRKGAWSRTRLAPRCRVFTKSMVLWTSSMVDVKEGPKA